MRGPPIDETIPCTYSTFCSDALDKTWYGIVHPTIRRPGRNATRSGRERGTCKVLFLFASRSTEVILYQEVSGPLVTVHCMIMCGRSRQGLLIGFVLSSLISLSSLFQRPVIMKMSSLASHVSATGLELPEHEAHQQEGTNHDPTPGRLTTALCSLCQIWNRAVVQVCK